MFTYPVRTPEVSYIVQAHECIMIQTKVYETTIYYATNSEIKLVTRNLLFKNPSNCIRIFLLSDLQNIKFCQSFLLIKTPIIIYPLMCHFHNKLKRIRYIYLTNISKYTSFSALIITHTTIINIMHHFQ